MNVYRFVDSKDIREHLESLNYPFTGGEAAFLIHQSRYATLDEKIRAWEEIIRTMPDCAISGGMPVPSGSLHNFLRQYISILQKQIEFFYQQENAIYYYSEYESATIHFWNEDGWSKRIGIFSDFRDCLFHHKSFVPPESFQKVAFYKKTFSRFVGNKMDASSETEMVLVMDSDYRVLRVDSQGVLNGDETEIERLFNQMSFEFPIPFRCGDIVCEDAYDDSPCIFFPALKESFSTIWKNNNRFFAELDKIDDKRSVHKRNFNMACFVLRESFYGIYVADAWNYLNLERCRMRSKDQDRYRLLLLVSDALSSGERLDLEMISNQYSLKLQGLLETRLHHMTKALTDINLALKLIREGA